MCIDPFQKYVSLFVQKTTKSEPFICPQGGRTRQMSSLSPLRGPRSENLRSNRIWEIAGTFCGIRSLFHISAKKKASLGGGIPPPPTPSGMTYSMSTVDCDRNRRARLLKKQPVQTLYGFSNQIVPRACFPDGIRVSNLPGVQID